jgi:predicted regulator of Ras-like GTPase activity (Roadblock/LC7/MglB family)
MTKKATIDKINEYGKLLLPLEEIAKSKGVKAFNMIGRVVDGKLKLINKIDEDFHKKITTAIAEGDKKFFLDNIDHDKYSAIASSTLRKGIKILEATTFSNNEEEDAKIRGTKKVQLKSALDIFSKHFNGFNHYAFKEAMYLSMKYDEHQSAAYKEMTKTPEALKVWEFFMELNDQAEDMGYLDRDEESFFPLVEATIAQKLGSSATIGGQLYDSTIDLFTARLDEEQHLGKVDPETGKIKEEVPKYYLHTNKKVEQLSTDLNKVGALWISSLLKYQTAKEMESTLLTLHKVEEAKGSIIVDGGGAIVFEGMNPKVNPDINKNADVLKTIISDFLYNLTENNSSLGGTALNIGLGKLSKDKESADAKTVKVKKAVQSADTLVKALAVGLKPLIGLANWAGYQFQAYINGGQMYTFKEFTKNNVKASVGNLSIEEKGMIDLIVPLNEDVITATRRELAKKEGYLKYLSTWTFSDVMMLTNSFPERKLQIANALSFNENSTVIDGKIVNIRQFVKEQDRKAKETMSESERLALEKSYEERVSALKEKGNLNTLIKVTDEGSSIPGVSDEELAKYRTKIIEYGTKLNGQMSDSNKAGYRRDTMFSSFMMFKHWIPKLVETRAGDISKNHELNDWEYGHTRVLLKTIAKIGFRNIADLRDIINGTDKGLAIIKEMYEQKKDEYYRVNGTTLEITQDEFQDLIRKAIGNQFKEIQLLLSVLALIAAAKVAQPPEDATDLEKNRAKWYLKAINKIAEEVTFYYDPRSAESITRSSIVPSFGLLTKIERILESLFIEGYAQATDDDKLAKKTYPLKYIFNMVPGIAQFQTEVLPFIDPELAKEMGIRVSALARRQ